MKAKGLEKAEGTLFTLHSVYIRKNVAIQTRSNSYEKDAFLT